MKDANKQHEPMAWALYFKSNWLQNFDHEIVAYGHADTFNRSNKCECYRVIPLYPHADTDEVERLRESERKNVAAANKWHGRFVESERKLAEAYALLKTHTDHVAQLCDEMFIQGLGMDKEAETKIYTALAQQLKVFALLSASEEPKQP